MPHSDPIQRREYQRIYQRKWRVRKPLEGGQLRLPV
jgi:hypothetical protein